MILALYDPRVRLFLVLLLTLILCADCDSFSTYPKG